MDSSHSWGGRRGARMLFFPMVAAAAAMLVWVEPAAAACYPRVFSFGDSLADTGNHRFVYGANDSDPALWLPYGETFFHRATGRFSNGRIVLDFIAEALGLPFVRPYLSGRRAEDFACGANFAVGGATALAPEFFRDRGFDMDNVVHLDMEMGWFRDMLDLLCPGDLADCSEMMSQSLFLVGEIGGNDYNLPLLANMPFDNVTAFVPIVIAKISSAIAELIGLGAKTLVVPGNLPIGCIPDYLLVFQSDEKEDYEPETGCIGWLNEFARYHNKLLIEELEKLRKLHPGVTIIYADNYGAAMDVFVSPEQYGIEYPLVACCGGGYPYGVTQNVKCGRGKYKLCRNPEKYGSWDGMHPSEAVYRAIAMGLLRGSYMQPPLATTANSSKTLGLPFVRPYLSGQSAEDFACGANFAVVGATALSPDFFRDRGFDMGDRVHLDMEMKWFREMLDLLCPGNLAGCSDMMNQSLFLVGEIGGNDYNIPLHSGVPFEKIRTFTPSVVAKISSTITELIQLGAKTLMVPVNLPIGCIPEYLMIFKSDNHEDYEPQTGCLRWMNEFSQYHNKLLMNELKKLRKLHPGVTIIYADYYGAAMEIFHSPEQYGIEHPLVACCGGGELYGVSPTVKCGSGEYKVCDNPEKYGSWDGLHPSEAANRAIAMGLLRGPYTQPSIASTTGSCPQLAELGSSAEYSPLYDQ